VEIDAGFAPAHDGTQWTYSGSLTFANAGSVLAAAAAMRLPDEGEVDQQQKSPLGAQMLDRHMQVIVESDHTINPWSPKTAPRVELLKG